VNGVIADASNDITCLVLLRRLVFTLGCISDLAIALLEGGGSMTFLMGRQAFTAV
jgi:hypothetical protein